MTCADELVGNERNSNDRYCLAKDGEVYLVYLPYGGPAELDLSGADGEFDVRWFNPREGGELLAGTATSLTGGGKAALGEPPGDAKEDWLVVIRR